MRGKNVCAAIGAALGLACLLASQAGAQVNTTLGDQDFTNGTFLSGVAAFNTPSVGEPAPFDQFRGSDPVANSVFSESFTFNYAPIVGVTSATITLGIFDHDSQAAGNQVASFTVDGNDLTALLNADFEARGGSQAEYNVYTVALPGSAFAALLDGSATFGLTLAAPSLGAGATPLPGNGAGLDFATLRINTSAIPESGTLALLASSLLPVAGAVIRRRRSSN